MADFKQNVLVAVLMGSASDHEVMKTTEETLRTFGISVECRVLSAHRSPALAAEFVTGAKQRGVKVIIAAAGGAAHLAGAVAAHTTLPVIGVPLASSDLHGFDALLSTVQMPSGVPVATVSIGKWGAKNAAILAAQILALSDPKIAEKLEEMKRAEAKKIAETVL